MTGAYVGTFQKNWDSFLANFAYTLRTAIHDFTGKVQELFFIETY